MINLHKLEIFTQVVQAGSFSRAAQGLLMTQSAVSQHINDLESNLGAELFKRGPRGVTLTAPGETLYDYTQRIFQLLAEAQNAVTDVAKLAQGQLNIGATPGVSVYLLPIWLQTFREHYPNLVVTLHTGTSSEVLEALRTGRADVAIIEGELAPQETEWLGIQPLQEVEQQVVVGTNHPWSQQRSICIEKLDGKEAIMRQSGSQTRIWLDEMLKQVGVSLTIKGEFDNLETIKRAVAMGRCLTILPPYVVEQEVGTGLLHALSIQDQPLQRTLKLIWPREKPSSPVVNAFCIMLKVEG